MQVHEPCDSGNAAFENLTVAAPRNEMPQRAPNRSRSKAGSSTANSATQLLDDFPEYPGNRDVTEREQHRPHQRKAEQENHGMGEPQPEVTGRPERRHRIGLAG